MHVQTIYYNNNILYIYIYIYAHIIMQLYIVYNTDRRTIVEQGVMFNHHVLSELRPFYIVLF